MAPYSDILAGLPTTLALTALAMVAGAIAGVPLMLARRSERAAIRGVARALIDVLRGLPPIVWLFIMFFGLAETGIQLTPFTAATVGLGAISAAYLAEVYRGGLMSVHRGQWEAARALGLGRRDQYRYVLGPQAVSVALPAAVTYAIALIKDTSLAYTIGVQEVLFRANREEQLGTGSALTLLLFAAALYTVLSLMTASIARMLHTRMKEGVAR